MIQLKRKLYGLDKLYYDYVDTDPRSRNIFRILELPETFNLGRNQFKVLANNEVLLKNAKIYIDIADANNQSIYYEISPIANKDNSKSVIVYIYPDTPAGNCTIRIASRLYIDPRNGETIFFNDNIRDEPNVLWSSVVNVSPYQQSESKIKFLAPPSIVWKERIEQLQIISGSTRLTTLYATGSEKISMRSNILPKQLNPSAIDVERVDIQKKFVGQPNLSGDEGISKTISLPYFFGLSSIQSTNFVFSSSMQGGTIYVNGIDVDYPAEAVTTSSFFGLSYSASIVNVINDNLIEVSPPFQRSLSYRVADGSTRLFSVKTFNNHSHFTTSFFDLYNLSSSLVTQSFLELNLSGIEPIAGVVDTVNVSYKTVNSFGDFVNVGDFEVNNNNVLVDRDRLSFNSRVGVIEKPIGYFPSGAYDFNLTWDTGSIGGVVGSIQDKSAATINVSDGILIKQIETSVEDKFLYIKPKDHYAFDAKAGTEFDLSFSSYFGTANDGKQVQVDVYITGSNNVYSDIVTDNLKYSPKKNVGLGAYIGSVSANNGVLRSDTISFLVREDATILPVFAVRSGVWHFGKVEMRPRKSIGFSPNQSRIFVPLTDVERESELNFRVEYKDRFGIRSDEDTRLYGLYFQGSSPIQFSDIANVPDDLGALAVSQSAKKNYIIQKSASVDPGTAVVDVIFPIFIDEIRSQPYTGSNYNVGMSFQVDTVIFGRSGSYGLPEDTYVWAGSIQGRAIVSAFDNSGQPQLYTVVAVSGSNLNTIGTFGPGPSGVFPNRDSWFRTQAVVVTGSSLFIRYNVTPTLGDWSVFASSNCTVWKYADYFIS